MTSTSTADPSSAMAETPNWLEMPHEIMAMILQRLGAVEILDSAQKVCTTWRRICKDPAMWKVIDIHYSSDGWDTDYDIEKLTKQAVHRSCGELIDISLECFGTDDLLDHISRCSSKLKHLRLTNCYSIRGSGLTHAVKNLPHLETLHLFYTSIYPEDIEVIGRNCPHLKSFKMKTEFRQSHIECDADALAIASSMPALRHLQLFGSKMTDDGLQVILQGCPHLESLDLRRCFNLKLGGNLGKLCKERIKDFKRPNDSTEDCGFCAGVYDFDEFDDMNLSVYCDIDGFYDDHEVSDDSIISADDDEDYYLL
ncbi:hypothetical protein L6452_35761 [Arctium lappa]|uniref:Uncharacterized protein n=1 Tax=Arctium lappa TaxID=4217 RepID=A0ACB8Y7F8_ARCLA|nr:hypothetical protein L6452_35761 [Arctium lappa]